MFLALVVAASPAAAQSIAPGLSGTWTLAPDADAGRNRRPITGLSIATRLVITESPDALTVEGNTGTGNTIVTTRYQLDGSEHPIPGPIGWDTRAKSAWNGTTLEVAITRVVQGPDGALTFEIVERYTAEGDTLTLERRQGTSVQTLRYRR